MVTSASALLSVLVYCAVWSMPIACGLVLGMWVHELGHLAVVRRLGLPSSPIVFVPFVGAVQRIRARPAHVFDAAVLAVAGPACGLLFAVACKLGYATTGHDVLRFLGTAHAVLAVIDLLPLGALDGGRLLAALRQAPAPAKTWLCALYVALFAVALGLVI